MGLGLDDMMLEFDLVAPWKALIPLDSHIYMHMNIPLLYLQIHPFFVPPQLKRDKTEHLWVLLNTLNWKPQLAPVSEESGAYEPQVGGFGRKFLANNGAWVLGEHL